jgi:indole-3-glycerol phosphate synthase
MGGYFLKKILDQKGVEVENAKKELPEGRLLELADSAREPRPFFEALASPGPHGTNVIAEIKRASPSRGAIRMDLDPESYARTYERGGAAALSVLTDQYHFHGSPQDLKRARQATGLPVLRKDFVITTYQIYESLIMEADCVLLIVRALQRGLLKDCLDLCAELQLDALVEVHSEGELETASWAGARLIGINNRDLETFQTDIQTSVRLSGYLHPGQVAVAESGIKDRAQVEQLLQAGIWNFLIGESLVRAPDGEGFLRHLLGSSDLAADPQGQG